MAPRSPTDATRFTATGPYVSTKPPPGFSPNPAASPATSGTRIDFGVAPPNETPQQKIARLRAAAQLARRGHETGFDKAVRIGRIWADRAHRVTALSLVGLTVIAGAVATAGITDMLLHNRRRRNEWLAEKQAQHARDLAIARTAEARGSATEDQMLLINQQRAADEAAEAKKNRPGMLKRASNYVFSGLAKEEQKGGKLGASAAAQAERAAESVRSASATAVEEGKGVLKAVEDNVNSHRRQGEEIFTPAGGPLDRQADAAVNAISNTTRSWTSWITGK